MQTLIKKIIVLSFVGFFVGLCWPKISLAQTKSQMHQKNYNQETNHVHARGEWSKQGIIKTYDKEPRISSFAHRIDWLFNWTTIVSFIFFLIMTFAIIYFIIFNRAKPGKHAFYTHGHGKKEHFVTHLLDLAVFISLDCVILIASFMSTGSPFGSDWGFIWNYPSGPNVVRVQVMPQQWGWNFRQAGVDDRFNTKDDIVTWNELVIPKNKKVMVQMKSRDVIHGFWIPAIAIQMDAQPGQVSKFWFDSTQVGDFEIVCAHLCGTNHYKMKAFLKVVETQDFADWKNEMSEWALKTYDESREMPRWGWDWGINQPKTDNPISAKVSANK